MRAIVLAVALLLVPGAVAAQTISFGDGTHLVGTDVIPATYEAPGGEGCYWERLSGFGGTLDEVIANDDPSGPVVVTIAASDAGFKVEDCGTWTPIVDPPTGTAPASAIELLATEMGSTGSLGVRPAEFADVWNGEVLGREYAIARPKIREHGRNQFFAFTLRPEAWNERSDIAVHANLDDAIRTAALTWSRVDSSDDLDVSSDDLNGVVAASAFVIAVNPDLRPDESPLECLEWPRPPADGSDITFLGLYTECTVSGVTYTLAGIDAAGEDVWLTARQADEP